MHGEARMHLSLTAKSESYTLVGAEDIDLQRRVRFDSLKLLPSEIVLIDAGILVEMT